MMKRLIIIALASLVATAHGQYMPRINASGTSVPPPANTATTNVWSETQVFDEGAILNGSNPLLYFHPSAPGAYQVQRFANNEPGTADFGMVLTNYPGSNGLNLQDNVFTWGYNVSPIGRLNPAEHLFSESIESRYKTSQGIVQLEHYYTYQNAAGTGYYRPFSQTIHLETDYIETGIRADTLLIGAKDASFDWLQLTSRPFSGQMLFQGDSHLFYNGSRTDWLYHKGSHVLGYETTEPNSGRLFSGANNLKLFSEQNINDGMSLTLGGYGGQTRGLRWWQGRWQFQTDATTWQNMGEPANYWRFGPYTGVGPSAFRPAEGQPVTLDIFDSTPQKGASNLRVRLGAGQNRNPLEVTANDGITQLYAVGQNGVTRGFGYRTFGDEAALQHYHDTHALSLGSGVDIAFSGTSKWTGAKDVGLARGASGQLRVTNGSNGYGRLEMGVGVTWRSGAGSPEGVVAANPGSLYTRTDGSAGMTLYVKESGTSATGWVAK